MPTRHPVKVERVFYDPVNKRVVVNGQLMGRPVQLPIWSIDSFKFQPGMDRELEMSKLAALADDKLRGKQVTLECPDP